MNLCISYIEGIIVKISFTSKKIIFVFCGYLFLILKYLFLGNFLWLIPEVIVEPAQAIGIDWEIYVILLVGSKGGALLSFIYGLSRILRYQKLRAFDEETNNQHTPSTVLTRGKIKLPLRNFLFPRVSSR